MSTHQREQSGITLTPRGEKAKAGAIALGLVGGTALALAGVATVAKHFEGKHLNPNAKLAVADTHKTLNNVIILQSGARYRVTPNGRSDAANEIAKVPEGKELVIPVGVVSGTSRKLTSNQAGWIGFTRPDADSSSINTLDERIQATAWVDVEALEDQGLAERKPSVLNAGNGHMLNSRITDNGALEIEREVSVSGGNGAFENHGTEFMPVQAGGSYLEPAGTYDPAEAMAAVNADLSNR
jgi:hypothetical protein